MHVPIRHIEQLLEQLAKKTKQRMDYKGFGEMSAMVSDDDSISQKYLYENLHLKAMKAKEENIKVLSLQVSKLNTLAAYLKYPSFTGFCEHLDRQRDVALVSCIGTYYCYVRRNAEDGIVMRSPVQIIDKDNKVWFSLRGPTWIYEGEAELKNGCLFVLMRAPGGKEIHHVYKLGRREKPLVLQGIFSGVSTVFEPIGGRTVLMRTEEGFDALKNKELEVDVMKKSTDKEQRRLGEYFSRYEFNNLKINSVTTFTIDDLGKCK